MYPEIMVIPMREELTRMGVQELRTRRRSRSCHCQPTRDDHGNGEFHLRLRGRANAAGGSDCAAEFRATREDVLGVRRAGQRGHRAGSQLLYRVSSVVAFDRVASRWEADSYDAAQRY